MVSGETGTRISRDEYIANVAKDIEDKIPQVFDLDQIRKGFGPEITPTTVVLLQELERFNKLIIRMAKSLAELQRVSKSPATRGDQSGFTCPGLALGRCLSRPWLGKLE